MAEVENEPMARDVENQRNQILDQLEDWLEIPMLVLSFIWLALFIIEMVNGLSRFLETAGTVIWVIFGLDFLLKFILATDKLRYLKSNWITLIALLLPALRVFRALRAFRLLGIAKAARGVRLVRLLTSLNRGMKALSVSFGKRAFGYVSLITLIVLFGGAAGMYGLENEVNGGFRNYSDALWWTAMLLTSIGSDYFPKSGEGRMLCLILSVYGFAVFGYVTATLATFFVHQDTPPRTAENKAINELKDEISELKRLLSDRLVQE